MANYLSDIAEFCSLSPFSEQNAEELEAKRPGLLMSLAQAISEADIDDRLRKRYAVPFAQPYITHLKRWVAQILTPEAFDALGVRPSDEIQDRIEERRTQALAQIKEAADSKDGLYELPLKSDSPGTSGIVRPAILSTSDADPYKWQRTQRDRASRG